MSERKKKTGDVVGWAVIHPDGYVIQIEGSRRSARQEAHAYRPLWRPYRIAKVVLAK